MTSPALILPGTSVNTSEVNLHTSDSNDSSDGTTDWQKSEDGFYFLVLAWKPETGVGVLITIVTAISVCGIIVVFTSCCAERLYHAFRHCVKDIERFWSGTRYINDPQTPCAEACSRCLGTQECLCCSPCRCRLAGIIVPRGGNQKNGNAPVLGQGDGGGNPVNPGQRIVVQQQAEPVPVAPLPSPGEPAQPPQRVDVVRLPLPLPALVCVRAAAPTASPLAAPEPLPIQSPFAVAGPSTGETAEGVDVAHPVTPTPADVTASESPARFVSFASWRVASH